MSSPVKKSTCDMYTLRSSIPHWWAIITLADNGMLNVQSDYGDYNYLWNLGGEPIRDFLLSCDIDYLKNKFGRNMKKVFNFEDTLRKIKIDILKYRHAGKISKDIAHQAWNFLHDRKFEVDDPSTIDDFYNYYLNHNWYILFDTEFNLLQDVYDGDVSSVPMTMDMPHELNAFFEIIWPEFIKQLKKEATKKA